MVKGAGLEWESWPLEWLKLEGMVNDGREFGVWAQLCREWERCETFVDGLRIGRTLLDCDQRTGLDGTLTFGRCEVTGGGL